ncbi:MAG: ABC transporter ATP-binding protein [Sakamotonia sp.]|jgi:oligopeptide/dipeptide ABC transporter ATP-binding protein
MMDGNLLEIKDLEVQFPIKKGILQRTVGHIHAVDKISFNIKECETLGLVGESGCGKTTTGRAILRLNDPSAGSVYYKNEDLLKIGRSDFRDMRKNLQIIFQDPYSSLNPRQTVKGLLNEVLTVKCGYSKVEATERINELLMQVGLSPVYANRYPHEFSGGQRQRIAIARALALMPEFIVCDEAVSALDVSIQSQIINLLMDLKDTYKITYLFISHALNVVQHISDRVAVMYLGKIVELAETEELFSHAAHPYTQALLSAVPILSGHEKRERIILKGEVPGAAHIPSGCRFHTRCPMATKECMEHEPELREVLSGHMAACHHL